MISLFLVLAVICAFIAGSILASTFYIQFQAARRKHAMRDYLGSQSLLDVLSISLECSGMSRWVISVAIRTSRSSGDDFKTLIFKMVPFLIVGRWESYQTLLDQAGLHEVLTKNDFVRARMTFMVMGILVGVLLGCAMSVPALMIGAVMGLVWGWRALPAALKDEAESRSFVAEKHLSQMIEIVVLGLNCGMTFDRALSLFHHNFSGSLSRSMALVQGQWTYGLIERSEGLRHIARSYDSALFERLAENIIRSLRFGTSLAGNLSILAAEARAIRKAKLEEKVAKAPVKMLLPVGTLILPAMLILVMGPIMLDLMQGF